MDKALELIAEKVGQALTEQGFERRSEPLREDKGIGVLYTGEAVAYSVMYETGAKRFLLRTASMTDKGPDGEWKNLSTWMYDAQNGSDLRDAESIANDFVETIQGPKRVEAVRESKKKRKKDDEYNVDPVFFFNRTVNIFPEIREELAQERIEYGRVRAVTFARTKLLPKMENLAKSYPDSDPYNKLCALLNDMYQNGDMDVRSIVTMVLLNGFSDESLVEKMSEQFSDDLKKGWKFGKKYKGRKVKPEKKKKRVQYTAENLNELRRR